MYYIYQHLTLDNIPFYVGKGTFNKKYSYGGYNRAYSKSNRTKEWKKIAENGYKVNIILESENLSKILEEEDKLWENCPTCINKQINKKFKDYKLVKINSTIGVLFIFKKTYIIVNNGDVFNYLGTKLDLSIHNNGYLYLTVSNGSNKRKNFYIHRLVGELFVPNLNNYPNINHDDLNRKNNNDWNLTWCTQEQNVQHSVNLGSYKCKERIKRVLQFSKTGEFIKEWSRASEISDSLNCTEELIQQACQQKNIHKTPTSKGYIWIYKNDYDEGNRNKFNKTIDKYKNQ